MGPIRGFRKRKRAEKKVDQNVLAAAALSSLKSQPQQQQQQQPSDWWDDFSKRIRGPLSGSRNSKNFESIFKISRKTFDYICSLVNDELRAKLCNLTGTNGKPLSLNDQVAIALRRLSSGESLSIIGDSFGVNQSTVSHITWRFVEAMEENGLHHLRWPSTEAELAVIKSKFEKLCGLPNCCGVIDITHIVMTLPAVDHSNDVWIDREKNHSMVLQAIVDPDMRFRDIIVGYPGSLSDALVLQNSSFFKLTEEGERLNGKKMELMEGTEFGEYIIGDAGFPLLPWLLTPYQRAHTNHQVEFNRRHSATRLVAQIALARLKEMWRIIHGVMWLPDKNKLPRIIFVCCLLHNILIDMEDKAFDGMPMSHHHDKDYQQQICESASSVSTEVREKLSLYISGPPGNRVTGDAELVKSQDKPFHKSSFVWVNFESMEVFQRLPQKPHFSPLIEFEEASREGLAMRHMMTFAILVEKTSKLQVDDPKNLFQSYLQILADLELLGFDVKAVVERLNKLLSIKDRYEQLMDQLEKVHIQLTLCDHEMAKLEGDTDKTDETISESGEERAMKVTKVSAISAPQVVPSVINADILNTKHQFESLAAAPW